MHRAGAGWPSAKQRVDRRGQAVGADLIAVAGHSLGCTKHPALGRSTLDLCDSTEGSRKPGEEAGQGCQPQPPVGTEALRQGHYEAIRSKVARDLRTDFGIEAVPL